MIEVFVPGEPAPQGSKSPKGRDRNGHAIMVEASKKVKPWRESIRSALIDDKGRPIERFEGAVLTIVEFIMPRPQSTPKRRTPPAVKRPDLDKTLRAVNDAMESAGVLKADSIVNLTLTGKRLAEIGEAHGVRITLIPYEPRFWELFKIARRMVGPIPPLRFEESA